MYSRVLGYEKGRLTTKGLGGRMSSRVLRVKHLRGGNNCASWWGSSVGGLAGSGGSGGTHGYGLPIGSGYAYAPQPRPSSPPSGGQTRITRKLSKKGIKEEVKPVAEVVEGPLRKLIGAWTGSGGVTLESIKTITGTAGAAASKVLAIKGDDGVTYYITVSTSYS